MSLTSQPLEKVPGEPLLTINGQGLSFISHPNDSIPSHTMPLKHTGLNSEDRAPPMVSSSPTHHNPGPPWMSPIQIST